jgi:gas vesicle protein
MNSFFKGVLFGVGVGLLIAPMRGEEMRALLRQRFSELRGYLPQNEQLTQYTQQISNRVTETASNLRDYAQQAASTVKSSASNLGNLTHSAASSVKQAERDVADTTKQAAQAGKSAATRPSTTITPDTPPAH